MLWYYDGCGKTWKYSIRNKYTLVKGSSDVNQRYERMLSKEALSCLTKILEYIGKKNGYGVVRRV